MNAKKIMGAVLVALLAAALFVGAGAAAGNVYFLYQEGTAGTPAAGVYTAEGGYSVIVDDNGLITPGQKFESGAVYTKAGDEDAVIVVYNPDAEVVVSLAGTPSAVFTSTTSPGGAIPDTAAVNISVKAPFATTDVTLLFTSPLTGETFIFGSFDGRDPATGADNIALEDIAAGTWMVQAYFKNALNETAPQSYYKGTPYYFTIKDVGATITLSSDEVIKSNYFKVILTGVPGAAVYVYADKAGFTVPEGQPAVLSGDDLIQNNGLGVPKGVQIQLDASGEATFSVLADPDKKGSYTITYVVDATDDTKDKEASINVINGAITAETKKDSFFVGNKIELIGTSTIAGDLDFYIEGTNFKFTKIDAASATVKNDAWEEDIAYVDVKDEDEKVLIAGTYTIFVTTHSEDILTKEALMKGSYATVALTMVQPFISDVKANPVAIQGDDEYTITGIAEAAKEVRLYVFGTNYFAADYAEIGQKDNGKFEFTLSIGEDTDADNYMAPGTYFYLIQHPMNDGNFNVWNGSAWDGLENIVTQQRFVAESEADFFYAATDSNNDLYDVQFIFNAYKRGTNYAAQALLEEIAGQNIDDIFVQGTFEVAAQKLTVNPIPGEVTKGSALTVSGTSNSGEGVEVIVNVLAGTFGATVKGDDNAAIFLTAKAVTKDDGTWEAAIDTSKLPTGEYIVTVQIGTTMYDSAAVEIVEAADTPDTPDTPDVPDTPDTPDEPTEPETPGFGALAALAGLGAVAVLLLRRE